MLSEVKTKILEKHLEEKMYNMKAWLGEYNETGTGTFPYFMTGKARVSQNSSFEHPNLRDPLQIDPEQEAPSYIILIPGVRPSDDNPAALMQKITMIRDQAFENDAISSQNAVKKRLAVVLGINEFRSLDDQDVESFYLFVQSMSRVQGVAFRVIGFLWTPTWYMNLESGLGYDERTAYRLLKAFCPERAQEILISTKQQAKEQPPYQDIRETIKDSKGASELSNLVQELSPRSPQYVTTMDSDFYGLRSDSLGLFSHLDTLVQETVRQNVFKPNVMTTGYQAPADAPGMIKEQVHLDMLSREAMNRVIPGSAYFPEPCMSVLLAQGHTIKELSYKGAGSNIEARRLIQNGIEEGLIDRTKMVFSSKGPITTDVTRMITAKARGIGIVSARNVYMKKVLESLHGVSQSHAGDREWAQNLYLALPFTCSSVMDAYAPLRKFHQVFDPVKLAFLINSATQERYAKGHFQKAMKIHQRLVEAIAANNGDTFPAIAKELYSERDVRYGQCLDLFRTRLNDCVKAKQDLSELGLEDEWIDRCILAAKATGDAAREFLERFV